MSFQRAARTDKGVSAAANLLSLKMEMHEDTLAKLNSLLPKQIRVFGYNKTTQSFDAKNNCDGRTYTYILPTFAFCPIEEVRIYEVKRQYRYLLTLVSFIFV
jgi:tRNA pseudouridine38-40 synthase